LRSLLLFLGVWGVWVAGAAVALLILMWLLSIDDDRKDKDVASSLLSSIFWPLVWLYCRLTGKHSNLAASRAARLKTLDGTSETDSQGRGMRFRTIREAKDYLAGRIAEEAERNGTALTDVERKMLYFTETGWTLPDMKHVSAEFDRDYDQGEYEKKIGRLAERIQSRLHGQGQQERESWSRAIQKLSQGDHYLLVLVDAANPVQKGLRHNLKVLFVAIVLFALVALSQWFKHWLRDH